MKKSSGHGAWGRWFCLLGPLLSGCFPLLYAYPSLSFVPPFGAGSADENVFAFRVDITDERNGAEFPDHDRYVFREIPVSETARVPLQAKLDLDRGWVFFGPQTYSAHTHHAVTVRLYRPGYQTVEVARPDDAKRVRWLEAEDARAREKAIDDLMSTWKTDSSGQAELAGSIPPGKMPPSPEDARLFRCLAPGSVGQEHRRVLMFAADEYMQIWRTIDVGNDSPRRSTGDAERLMVKVNWLHQRVRE